MGFEGPNKQESKEGPDEDVLIYRGIDKRGSQEDRKGFWWSTNPYYAFRYAQGGRGEMYVSKIKSSELKKLSSDVSVEGEFENFF